MTNQMEIVQIADEDMPEGQISSIAQEQYNAAITSCNETVDVSYM